MRPSAHSRSHSHSPCRWSRLHTAGIPAPPPAWCWAAPVLLLQGCLPRGCSAAAPRVSSKSLLQDAQGESSLELCSRGAFPTGLLRSHFVLGSPGHTTSDTGRACWRKVPRSLRPLGSSTGERTGIDLAEPLVFSLASLQPLCYAQLPGCCRWAMSQCPTATQGGRALREGPQRSQLPRL